jgi:hypothetical protein
MHFKAQAANGIVHHHNACQHVLAVSYGRIIVVLVPEIDYTIERHSTESIDTHPSR